MALFEDTSKKFSKMKKIDASLLEFLEKVALDDTQVSLEETTAKAMEADDLHVLKKEAHEKISVMQSVLSKAG